MKRSTTLLLALALTTTPVTAALGQTSNVDLGAFVQAETTPVVTVTKADGLSDAINEANKMFGKNGVTAVTIKLPGALSQKLPSIKANGKLIIVGEGDVPANTAEGKAKPRPKISAISRFSTSILQSPIEFRGVEFTDFNRDMIEARDGITIVNSIIRGKKPFFGSYGVFLTVDLNRDAKENQVVIKGSDISESRVVSVRGGTGNVTIAKNSIMVPVDASKHAIEIEASSGYPTDKTNPVLIEENSFTSNKAESFGSLIRIGRPDVTVHNNTFKAEMPNPTFFDVSIFNPAKSSGAQLKNVVISYNRFSSAIAIGNHSGDPIGSIDAIKVHHNDFSASTRVLPIDTTDGTKSVTPDNIIDAKMNFWGSLDHAKIGAITTDPLDKYTPPTQPPTPSPNPTDSPSPTPSVTPTPETSVSPSVTPRPQPPVVPVPPASTPSPSPSSSPAGPRVTLRLAGESRVETAVQVARTDFKGGASTVILARDGVFADSVAAAPLSKVLNAPVLLTQSTSLHPGVVAEVRRLMPRGGKVILMGGEAALSKDVEVAVTRLGVQVERVAGENRAGTAVATAEMLAKFGKAKEFLVADGGDWQANLVAAPAAAGVDGAMLLTWGESVAPETRAYLAAHSGVKVTAIGAKAALATKAVNKIEADDPTMLSLAVARQFVKVPKTVGVATTVEFADALSGGAQVARHGGALLLSPSTVPASVLSFVREGAGVANVYVYGGPVRFSEEQLGFLSK